MEAFEVRIRFFAVLSSLFPSMLCKECGSGVLVSRFDGLLLPGRIMFSLNGSTSRQRVQLLFSVWHWLLYIVHFYSNSGIDCGKSNGENK